MKLLIVIVNYKTGDLTVDCLRSLESEVSRVPGTRVVVTDNASGDGSIEVIAQAIEREGWSAWARTMPLECNGGFAYGNNGAIVPALAGDEPPQYVLLLNPDTVVRRDGVVALVDFMDARPDVGIAGSRLEDPDATPQCSAFRFPSVASEFDAGLRLGMVSRLLRHRIAAPPVRDDAHATDWVAGASMIIRRDVFGAVGLLDEGFFMYYEEVDFCFRAKRAGWPCWYVPQSRVVHLVGQASGVTDTRVRPKRRPDYWFDSRRLFFVKNRGRLGAILADAGFAIGFALWRVRRVIQRKPDLDPPHMLWDVIRHSVMFRGVSI